MSIAFNGMPIGVTASSKIILLTNIIFKYNRLYPYSMYHNSPQLYSKNITGEAYLLQ